MFYSHLYYYIYKDQIEKYKFLYFIFYYCIYFIYIFYYIFYYSFNLYHIYSFYNEIDF